ncbi:hypothetical protein HOC32_00515, partial [Candidatus Woesearchaeota archaeon]|nr:hypothetical protein [Candidatus Woesearchaeota archaeon]
MTKRGLALLVLIVLVLSSVTVVAASDSECSGFIGFLECFFFGREDALVGGATEINDHDDEGRIISTKIDEDEDGVYDREIRYSYDENGVYRYDYDESGGLILEQTDTDGDGNIDRRITYDGSGNRVLTEI